LEEPPGTRTETYSNGILQVFGPSSVNNYLGAVSGYTNHGYLGVIDAGGTLEAGMYVTSSGSGAIFADIKNFRMEHPIQKDKEIWYACIEGPEAAAYERGTAELENGQAFISFSEHYQLVANPESMTVILTPHSVNTYGLAVVEKRADGFVVKELMSGNGNFGFDWEVKCVRKGYENYRVIRDKSELLPAEGTVQIKEKSEENTDSSRPFLKKNRKDAD
jgi:hypothetical protein